MRLSVHLIGAGALISLLGCGGEADDSEAVEPAVELGTGETAFEPLTEGSDIYIVQGPQGGFHFNASARAWGIEPGSAEDLSDPSNPTTAFFALEGEKVISVGTPYVQGLDKVRVDGGTAYEMIGRRVILDILGDYELDGHDVVLEVEIEDVDGNVVIDRRNLVAIPHPLNAR